MHGTHCFPDTDTNAHDQGENPQPLYSASFLATDLWESAPSDQDKVFLDLWQSHLECVEDK
ncbi:MAG: SH3-like domain-containing protein [Candidatus Rariloculaceae bacterium]